MKRAIRNRLVDLFLSAFDSHAKRDQMLWLPLYCEQWSEEDLGEQSVSDLMTAWGRRYPNVPANPGTLKDLLKSLRGLLRIIRPDGTPDRGMAVSKAQRAAGLRIRLHPDLRACLPDACDRVQTYLRVLEQFDGRRDALKGMQSLDRAVMEAALCFNAGLFFEAHEHLEQYWHPLKDGPTRRYLQGIIQISVGFHHAMRGSHDGAVNQLRKGLAKLSDAPDGALGLDRDRFVRDVSAAREAIVARGRAQMRPVALQDLPRMHLRPSPVLTWP